MKNKEYSAKVIGLIGLEKEFNLSHIPFLVADNVMGVFAYQGSSGTGKTTLAQRLCAIHAKATNSQYGIHSADKTRYEDFRGIPIPNLNTKKVETYPMDNSISEQLLLVVDEINRASYDSQEKFLSLFASRIIDGIKVKTKYIYVAMNPVLSNGSDIYEGTQPLDKAMGERVMALVDMPSFNTLSQADRLEIIKCGLSNQADWEPSDELCELHLAFIKSAKENYIKIKNNLLNSVVNYIDNIGQLLFKETKGSLQIQSRRAQFIATNIIATHAIKLIDNPKTKLGESALDALFISFPNPLWEQPVSKEMLFNIHKMSLGLLEATRVEYSYSPIDSINNLINDCGDLSLEQISKDIFNTKPNDNSYEYSIYALAVVNAIGKNNGILKNEEFSIFKKVQDKIKNIPLYKKYVNTSEKIIKANYDVDINDKIYSKIYPYYVNMDTTTENVKESFLYILTNMELVEVLVSIENSKHHIDSLTDVLNIIKKYLELKDAINELNVKFIGLNGKLNGIG